MSFDSPSSFFESNTLRCRAVRAALCGIALLLCTSVAPPARAQQGLPIESVPGGPEPLFAFDTPIGPLEYRSGRGLRVGNTGLTVGGFSVVEFNDEEHGDLTIELDSITFLVLYEPVDALRFFAELEVGGLAFWDADRDDFDHDPDLVIERLYVDWSRSDALNLRIGKFQTPVGRFNLVPAEPFIWTSMDPVQTDTAFDEHQTGAALFGTIYPGGNPLRYWLYGQMVDPIDADEDAAARSAGTRLEYGGVLGDWSVGTSLHFSKDKGEWQYLAGLDALAQLGPIELTTEAVFSEGNLPDHDLWSVYLQGVYDLGAHVSWLRTLYFVARFEHFDRDGHHNEVNLWDLGLTWFPTPGLNVKVGYRLADRVTDDVAEGISASISVLF